LHTEFFVVGRGKPLCRLYFHCCDGTFFRAWSPIVPDRNHLNRAKKFQMLFRWLCTNQFLIRVQAFRYPLRGELPHVQIFINAGPNPLSSDAQLLSDWLSKILRSSKIISWIWSIISGVVTVLGRPGQGESHVEKSPRLTWDITVFDDGIRWYMFLKCFCQNGLNFLRRLSLQEYNFVTARVTMFLKCRTSPDMLPFSPRNKKRLAILHMNRPLFPTTLPIASYDMEKYVELRTYQHPLVY
jgi:hypothetical protein